MRNLPLLFAVTAGAFLQGCGADDSNGRQTPPLPPTSDWVAARLSTTGPPCTGQRAFVPRAGTTLGTATSGSSEIQRTEQPIYVSYQVRADGLFAYFSFDPTLPRSNISTETARTKLKYAYVNFGLKQPAEVGGRLTLLSSEDGLLDVGDFERFEVENGQLKWRLVRRSADHYAKMLSIYDQDPTNDPMPRDACVTDDIVGVCYCDFAGPAITVTLEGTTALLP
jgi:hypothetical protein